MSLPHVIYACKACEVQLVAGDDRVDAGLAGMLWGCECVCEACGEVHLLARPSGAGNEPVKIRLNKLERMHMKHVLFALVFAAAAAHSIAAPAPVQDLAVIDAGWNDLRLKGDAKGLGALLAEDWMLTHSDGRVQYKADYLQELATRTRTNSVIENADVKLRTYGGTAVVTGTSIQSGTNDGKPWQGKFRFTRVWVQMQGKWTMVSSHSSRMSP